MNKILIAQLLLVAGVIFLILNLVQIDFNSISESKGSILGIISNILLILGMLLSIKEMKKLSGKT